MLCCSKCGTKQLDALASCPHVPVYKSLFADQFANSKQTKGIEVPFPQRDFSRQTINVLEIGCGVGNTVFPLLEKNAEALVTCGDFSKEAIQILKQRPRYDESVIKARVLDALNIDEDLKDKYDYCILNFVLSALSSAEDVDNAIGNALSTLKFGGVLLIYDYFTGDYRQEKRLNRGEKPRVTAYGNLFQRQAEDTNALYFN